MRTMASTSISRFAACGALALAACQANPRTAGGGAGDAGDVQDPAGGPAQAFRAWAYSLPEESALPPMTGTMTFRMSGDLTAFVGGDAAALDLPLGATPDYDVQLHGQIELESWTRMRAQLDLRLDLGPLRAQNPEPLLVGVLLIADGEAIWLEPDWSKAWFLDQLQEHATGVERLVFTLGTETVKELMEAVAGTMQGEAAEWYRSSITCASNPAHLTRLLADRVTIETFARRDGRIVADLAMDMSEWMPPELQAPGFRGPLRYRCEFDAATGAVLYTSYTLDLAEQGISMSLLQEMKLAKTPFAEDRFVYVLPTGRQAFPVDVFLRPAVAALQMETGQRPPDSTDDDLPF